MPAFLRPCLTALFLLVPSMVLAQGRPAAVSTAPVDTRSVAETVSVFGEIITGRASAVAARVGGIAVDVSVRTGDRVSKGDVLARLDTELLEIETERAEAEVAIARAGISIADAQLDRAEQARARAQRLAGSDVIERTGDYAAALGDREQALARLVAAEIAVREARYRLENAVVHAPFDGVVLSVPAEIGQFIASGSEVATLIDTGALEVEANVPARYIPALDDGIEVRARTDAADRLTLQLRAILPTEFSATRTRPVLFDIVEGSGTVAQGQAVTLEVPVSAPRTVTVVPKDALVQSGGGWIVFVNADGTAQPRGVEVGIALADGFEVLSGLAPGDEVVVRGNERLRPGQPIAPSGGPPEAQRGETPEAGSAAPREGGGDDDANDRSAARAESEG